METKKLSKKQKQIYDVLNTGIKRNGYPPTVREICEAVGLRSTSTVHNHIEALERKGYIRRSPTKSRSTEILIDVTLDVPIQDRKDRHDKKEAPPPDSDNNAPEGTFLDDTFRVTIPLGDGVVEFVGSFHQKRK